MKLYFLLLIFSLNHVLCVQKICNISIPKAGTHLLVKLIKLMSNCRSKPLSVATTLTQYELRLGRIRELIFGHSICDEHNLAVFDSCKDRCSFIFIYRDPRDQVVSMAYWIKKTKDPKYLASKTIHDLITFLITDMNNVFNYGKQTDTKPAHNDIAAFYNLYLPWKHIPGVYVTTFEKLVGKQGGGTLEQQLIEISNIANHIGIYLDEKQLINAAEKLFGSGGTFREGKIGSWKTHFTQEQKELFKQVAGQLLIDLEYETDLNW